MEKSRFSQTWTITTWQLKDSYMYVWYIYRSLFCTRNIEPQSKTQELVRMSYTPIWHHTLFLAFSQARYLSYGSRWPYGVQATSLLPAALLLFGCTCIYQGNKHLLATNVTEIQFNISIFKPQSRASINTSIQEVSASAMMPPAASKRAKWPDLTKATMTGVLETCCFEQNFQKSKRTHLVT